MQHWRYSLFLSVLLLSPWPFLRLTGLPEAMLAGFDLAVLVFILACARLWRGGNADAMRIEAQRDDAGQILLLILTMVISFTVLMTLGLLFVEPGKLGALQIALVIATLMASWIFANLIYAFHYARLYYSKSGETDYGGLHFPGDDPPAFADFVNFAFVIGMTCQTADIEITDGKLRRISTYHGLFAFAFNLVVLALTVNVLASTAIGQ